MQAKHARANSSKTMPLKNLPSRHLPLQDDDDDIVDMDAFRNDLARRLHQIIARHRQSWRTCSERACRRGRRCCAATQVCAQRGKDKPVDPQKYARFMARLQRMLREGVKRNEAEEKKARLADQTHEKS